MNWQAILLSVISIVLTALVSWGAERLIALINSKLANSKYAKYLTSVVDVITRAVKTTYQTYVETLKNKDMFTADAQKEALSKAGEMALAQLSEDSKEWIKTNFGDVKVWISNTIESVIYDLKNKPSGENTNEEA
jgi:hypothetical protein